MEKRKIRTEHQEQVDVIKFWSCYCITHKRPSDALFAIPNGGRRTGRNGYAMVAEGLKKGVPDLFLAIPNKNRHGLFIEMKRTKGGIISEDQKKYLALLDSLGYDAFVAYGSSQAIGIIKRYLGEVDELNDSGNSSEDDV